MPWPSSEGGCGCPWCSSAYGALAASTPASAHRLPGGTFEVAAGRGPEWCTLSPGWNGAQRQGQTRGRIMWMQQMSMQKEGCFKEAHSMFPFFFFWRKRAIVLGLYVMVNLMGSYPFFKSHWFHQSGGEIIYLDGTLPNHTLEFQWVSVVLAWDRTRVTFVPGSARVQKRAVILDNGIGYKTDLDLKKWGAWPRSNV